MVKIIDGRMLSALRPKAFSKKQVIEWGTRNQNERFSHPILFASWVGSADLAIHYSVSWRWFAINLQDNIFINLWQHCSSCSHSGFRNQLLWDAMSLDNSKTSAVMFTALPPHMSIEWQFLSISASHSWTIAIMKCKQEHSIKCL